MPFKSDKQRKKVMMELNANRTRQALDSDFSKRAINTLPYSGDNVKAWRGDPGRIDIEGIDTPMLKIDKIDDDYDEIISKLDMVDSSSDKDFERFNREWQEKYREQSNALPRNQQDEIFSRMTWISQERENIKQKKDTNDSKAEIPLSDDELLNRKNEIIEQARDIQKENKELPYSSKRMKDNRARLELIYEEMKDIDKKRAKLKKREPIEPTQKDETIELKTTTEDTPLTTDFKANPNLISRTAAEQAHSGTSFVPEQRAAQEQSGFASEVQDLYNHLERYAKSDAQKELLKSEMQQFQSNYAAKENELLRSRSGMMSSMIAGPSNFPTSRMEKKNRAYDNKYEDVQNWKDRAINSIKKKLKQQKIEDAGGEVALMKQNIENAEEVQQHMKDANKTVKSKKLSDDDKVKRLIKELDMKEQTAISLLEKDFAGRLGYASYQLTNNNANIKRMKDRVKEMEKKEATPTTTMKFSGGEIIDNNQADRVQIFFDEKPDVEMRSKLKGSGWHWSPSNGVWQRKRTNAAMYSAQQITGE